ncbi:MAG: hypothetical protein EHJ94_05275, partial [Deltaproteobacteria bacterium]
NPDLDSTYEHHDGVLVIGNCALTGEWGQRFPYVSDLGELWKQATGLPFVFAVWAVRKSFAQKYPKLVMDIARRFERSKQLGKMNMAEIQSTTSNLLALKPEDCKNYFNLLNYGLGHLELQGLKTFYQGLFEESIVPDLPKLSFIPTLIEGKKSKNEPESLSDSVRSGEMQFIHKQKQAWMNLGLLHFPLPLKKVFPQLLHLLRQGRL